MLERRRIVSRLWPLLRGWWSERVGDRKEGGMGGRSTFGKVVATLGLVVSAGAMAGLGVASPAGATPPPVITCSGTISGPGIISGGTYAALAVPPASACLIEGAVTVNSPVKLGSGSGVGVEAGSLTVNGGLTVGPDAAFGDFGSSSAPITINGPLFVQGNGYITMDGPTIGGPVWANDPSALQIFDTRIGGAVTINGGGGDNPVLDALDQCYGNSCQPPQYPYNQNFVWGDVISGPVSVIGYTGPWQGIVEDVMGPLVFWGNANPRGTAIGFDTINGFATCANNTLGPPTYTWSPPNTGPDVSGPSVVHGPVFGNQATTCTGVSGGTFPEG